LHIKKWGISSYHLLIYYMTEMRSSKRTDLRTMKHIIAKIISHTPVADCFYELTFEWDGTAGEPQPGQFCTIRVSPFSTPLLRRPFAFSLYDPQRGCAAIIYKRRGSATDLLAAKPAGDSIDVIGPLGTGFLTVPTGKLASPMCVAGGTGFGPMFFLYAELIKRGENPVLILGCRTDSQIPALKRIAGFEPIITTDDGSRGVKGTPVDYLAAMQKEISGTTSVCTCGPMPLMKGCHDWAQKRGISCYVSFEQTMACGVGACMGCAVALAGTEENRYARACIEGPVFDSKRILWI
jgi:dihydroorotate dehydrogenase electron transfer subunit